MKNKHKRDKRLSPDNREIRRRIAEELDFLGWLCYEMVEDEESYIPGEYVIEFREAWIAADERIKELITGLVGEPASNKIVISDEGLSQEGLTGPQGEAKTNMWRRLRDGAANTYSLSFK